MLKEGEYIEDLDRKLEKGDIIKIEGDNKIYFIRYTHNDMLKYNNEYFKKKGKKGKVSLIIKKSKKKIGGGILENIFNKREEEKLTIPYKYFYDSMEYFKIVKNDDKNVVKENNDDAFVKTMSKVNIFSLNKNNKRDLSEEEKMEIFKEEKRNNEMIENRINDSNGEREEKKEEIEKKKEEREEEIENKKEEREKELKIVIEGKEILKNTREYWEGNRKRESI